LGLQTLASQLDARNEAADKRRIVDATDPAHFLYLMVIFRITS
jgi:hypothetical protein